MKESSKVQEIDLSELDAGAANNSDEMRGKYLTFWTDGQLYGIPIADVVQIVGVQDVTPVPEYPDYAKGIMRLRGSIIPVIDVRLRFGKEEIPYNERTCFIVANLSNVYIGFVVDGVEEVTEIDDGKIAQTPVTSGERSSRYLTGIGKLQKKLVLLLDTQKLLSSDELGLFAEA